MLLTDEEILASKKPLPLLGKVKLHPNSRVGEWDKAIAKAQLKKVVEDMDKWIVGVDSEGLKMKATPDCALKWWQALLDEVKDG